MRTKSKFWVSVTALVLAFGIPVLALGQAFNPVVVQPRPINGTVVLAAGLATVPLQNGGYASTPICVATEQTSAARYIQISAISATSVSFTSSVTAGNTDTVGYECVGNPN